MNNKGQFTIIAALLVAVVLIATVIITYSAIRSSVVFDQPPIQSAIDETNFAIKQILGFTVGYYGSVLQVTANASYARMLALDYLQSGLVSVANMHPEWGASFHVGSSDLSTYWYTNSSYSMGNLTVAYNLTGLGISGVTYQTSCKLGIQVLQTVNNQSMLVVTKDDNESLVNLGKQNFRFLRYKYDNSSWERVNPTSEPTSYANGTYQIEIPSGVDPYSYLVEVEDPRGIVVIASSFSHYAISINWNQIPASYYAVSGSDSRILGAPDNVFLTVGKDGTCEVTDYQSGNNPIGQVYFNITYYGNVSGTLEWYYRLDGGSWVKIEDLPKGGTAGAPLTRAFNATSLRPSWTWANLNTTDLQFKNNDEGSPENAFVDAIYVTVQPKTLGNFSSLQESTVVIELLQNGTMRWLGQNLQMATQTLPIPPVPVKALHVNQTINGVNQEVPFQIEDWNHEYQVPAGLTSNGTVFSNRQMIVFLVNHNTTKVTIWWSGLDVTNQTSYAFENKYFTKDDVVNGILTNEKIALVFATTHYLYVDGFNWTSHSWTETGSSPYLNDDTSNYISHNVNNGEEGWFSFADLTGAQALAFGAMQSINVEFECSRSGTDDYFDFRLYDGTNIYGPYSITPPGSYDWRSYSVTSIIKTPTQVNNLKIMVRYRQSGGSASTVNIRRCRLNINLGGWLTSVNGNVSAKADFMIVNDKAPTYGSNLAYSIHHGIVRDVIHQEAEWSGGIPNCPNVYSQIVISLPANATYYTYRLRLMFVSSQQSRTISSLNLIKLSIPYTQAQTENGTSAGYPIVSNETASFYNYSSSAWQHHWSQIFNGTKGAGIMFTDEANQKLYVFDQIAGSKTGALDVNSTAGTIQLSPVKLVQASFTYALDVTWNGAIATFDGTTPIYEESGGTQTGLWMLVEYPPWVSVSTES